MVLFVCLVLLSLLNIGYSQVNITIGVVTAAWAGRSTDNNQLRYLQWTRQALYDINDGTIMLDPPLPSNVSLNISHLSSYASPSGAFNAANTLVSLVSN